MKLDVTMSIFDLKLQIMNLKQLVFIVLLLTSYTSAKSQNDASSDKKCYVGSTLFMLANFIDDPEPPNYYQLNFGYRLTSKDVLSIEIIRWNYYEPLGVPYKEKKTASNFPGKVEALGAGLAYKRFIWKDGFAQVHATALKQSYRDEESNMIRKGFQLFNTLRLGYQFRFFNNRIFLEPSIACTFWPINTNLPLSFQIQEDKYPNFFMGEPGLHFGFNF